MLEIIKVIVGKSMVEVHEVDASFIRSLDPIAFDFELNRMLVPQGFLKKMPAELLCTALAREISKRDIELFPEKYLIPEDRSYKFKPAIIDCRAIEIAEQSVDDFYLNLKTLYKEYKFMSFKNAKFMNRKKRVSQILEERSSSTVASRLNEWVSSTHRRE